MIIVRIGKMELATNSTYIEAILAAMDMSVGNPDEVEVLYLGAKTAGFRNGMRTFPGTSLRRTPTAEMPGPWVREISPKRRRYDRLEFYAALERNSGNVSRTARELGMSPSTAFVLSKRRKNASAAQA